MLPSVAIPRRLPLRATLARLGHERTVAIAIAGIVLGASFLSVAPAAPAARAATSVVPTATDRRRVSASVARSATTPTTYGRVEAAYVEEPAEESADDTAAYARPALAVNAQPRLEDLEGVDPAALAVASSSTVEGPFLDDGTLLKPVAVDTSVADGSALIRTYKVKAGDTLAGIAKKFDVSTMTLWWANKLKAKNALVRGQELKIPPVSGLVVNVTPADTLASLATSLQGQRGRDPRHEQARRPQPGRGPGARAAGRQGRAHLDAQAVEEAVRRAAAVERRNGAAHARQGAQGLLRRQLRLADLEPSHQPVLPLRPLRPRHRRLDR